MLSCFRDEAMCLLGKRRQDKGVTRVIVRLTLVILEEIFVDC